MDAISLADKVLIVSAQLARRGKFVDMDVIEAVLTVAQEIDNETDPGEPAGQPPIDPGSGYVPAGVRQGKR